MKLKSTIVWVLLTLVLLMALVPAAAASKSTKYKARVSLNSIFKVNQTPPDQNTDPMIRPAALPATGGIIKINASVVIPTGKPNINAHITRNGISYTTINLSNGGEGMDYFGSFTVGINSSDTPYTYAASVYTDDAVGNRDTALAVGTCVQTCDNKPPVITVATLWPNARPSTGGTIKVTATVTDADTKVNTVGAAILSNGLFITASPTQITLSNGGAGNVYTGSYTFGANPCSIYYSWTAIIVATDICGNTSTLPATGACAQARTKPLSTVSITDAAISPSNLPVDGGQITISCKDNNPDTNLSVNAELFVDGIYYASGIALTYSGADGIYSTVYGVPRNNSNKPQTYTAVIYQYDSPSQNYYQAVAPAIGSIVVAADTTPPVIVVSPITPSTLPATGGTFSFDATITDNGGTNTGVRNDVSCQLFKDGIYYTTTYPTQVVGDVYSFSYTIPVSHETADHEYTGCVIAYDNTNKQSSSTTPASCIQIADNTFPVINSAVQTPATLPATGGKITVSTVIPVFNDMAAQGVQFFKNNILVTDIGLGVRQNQFIRNPSNNHVYKMVSGNILWTDARDAAAATTFEGATGHLATISSDEEQQFIKTQLGGSSFCWLGGYQDTADLNYTEPAGGWKWVTGEPFNYTAWQAPYPDNSYYPSGDYIATIDNGETWRDYSNYMYYWGWNRGYIVEYDTTATTLLPLLATYDTGPNTSTIPNVYTAIAYATDNTGNRITRGATGTTTQVYDNAGPAVSGMTFTPASLTIPGGTLHFGATITEAGVNDTGLSGAYVNIYKDGVYIGATNLSNGGAGSSYTATFDIGINNAPVNAVYTANIVATDNVGNISNILVPGSCTQSSDAVVPVVTSATVSSSNMTPVGGTITVSATITDAGIGLNNATGYILRDGLEWATFALDNGGSGNIYSGTYNAGINHENNNHVYTAYILAVDRSNNRTILAATGSITQVTDKTGPTITSAALTPATINQVGGTLTITANVTDTGSGIAGVRSEIDLNGIYYAWLNLTNVGGNVYSGTYDAPANDSNVDRTWKAAVYAWDNCNNLSSAIATGAAAQTTSSPGSFPTFENVLMSPATLPANGGNITITADVFSGSGVGSVTGYILRNGLNYTSFVLNYIEGNTYSGISPAIPANAENYSIVYTAVVNAADNAGFGINTPVTGNCTQANDHAGPVVTTPTLSPATRPAVGGMITVTANVQDAGTGLSYVYARIFKNGLYYTNIGLSNGGDGNVFTGSYSFGANAGPGSNTFTAVIDTQDTIGNATAVAATGNCVQVADANGPVITTPTLTPATISPAGGPILIMAKVADSSTNPTGISSVTAVLLRDGAYFTSFPMNKSTGTNYKYTYNISPNNSTASHIYTAVIYAVDNVGTQTKATATGSATQATDNVAPVIGTTSVTPSTITAAGGVVTVSAVVTDTGGNNTGVEDVDAYIKQDGVNFTVINLSNGSNGSQYNGIYNLPATVDKCNHIYTFSIVAYDKLNNMSTVPVTGSVLQRTDTDAGGVSGAAISPKTLPVAGGTLTVNATVSGMGTTIPTVAARISRNGFVVTTVNLAVTGGTQITNNPTMITGNYTGTYTVPANTDGFVHKYTVTIYSTDMNGLASAGLALGECLQPAGAAEGALPVITNATVTPATVPISGGNIRISATIHGTRPVNFYSVTTSIYRNGLYYTWGYLYPDATGNVFTNDFAMPANTSGVQYTYTASISAGDGSRNNSVVASGAAVQGNDSTPPTVTGAAIAPISTISCLANTLIVSATITDTGTNASGFRDATAFIYQNGQYITQIGMSNGGIGTGYSAELTIPANGTKASFVWTAAIKTYDNAGNSTWAAVAGNVTQPKDNVAPVITGATLTPASRPASGGTITVTATVTDGNSGVNTVRAQIFLNKLYMWDIALNNGGGGNVYTGDQYFGANTLNDDANYTATVYAVDFCGNQTNLKATGSCFQPSSTPGAGPAVTAATMSPANLPATGGDITFNCTVVDLAAGQQVVVHLFKDNLYYTNVYPANIGGNDYSITYTIPGNADSSTHVYTSTTWVYDQYYGYILSYLATTGSTTVATDNTAPVITAATLSPASISIVGGMLTFSADVTDAGTAVKDVRAEISKNGVYFDTMGMNNNIGSTFTGTYNIGTPNHESAALTYSAVIVATDTLNNLSSLAATGTTTQPNDATAPSITATTITPATLPATGGNITVNSTIADANFNFNWGAMIFKDGINVGDVTFSRQNQLIRNPLNHHVYKMVTGYMDWSAARDAAAATTYEGATGHLATITSAEEQQFIQTQLGSVAYCWIGGYQDTTALDYSEPAGGWKWITDEPFTYTNWYSGYPSNPWGDPSNSLKIWSDGSTWIDMPDVHSYWDSGSYQNGYIVEYDTTGTTPIPVSLKYTVGINKDATSHVYTAVAYATDIAGNTATLPATGTTVQATDNVGPAISATMLTPTTMTALGGTIYFSATVTDEDGTNTGVETVQATVYQNGLNYTLLTLSNGGSGSLYTGEINVPVNKSQTPYKYSAMISAVDMVSNRTYLPANGICNQDTSIITTILTPNITYPEIGPKALTSLGGDIVIKAKIMSQVGVTDVNAQIYDNGVYYTTIGMIMQNDGTTYIGRYGIPINSDLFAHIYTATVYASDMTGNQTSQFAVGSCVEATDSGIPTQMIPAPTITSFTPTSAGPNMLVTITGTNFIGVTAVLIDGNMAQSYSVESDTTIKAIIAPGTTSGTIVITTMGGIAESATSFTFVAPVSISSISPNIGGVGTVVNITGVNFETTTGVKINGTTAVFTVVNPTTINATVAVGTTTGPIVVTTLGGTASSAPFTFVPVPTITSFTPATGPLGQLVTITGTNLATTTSVKFNGVNAAGFVVVNDTTVTAIVAVGTTTGKITVATLGGTVLSVGNFTFIPAPTITSFTPAFGDVSTVVAITGTTLTGATSVKFNGMAAASFTVVNATTINATVAVGTTTGPISVITPGGTGISASNFIFMPKPTITFFTPATGGAGTVITIVGTNLSSTSSVKVGGVSIAYNVVNDTVVTATVSSSTVTGSVAVTTLSGTATSTTPFTFIPAPTITSFTPATGISGTAVVITGTNFTTTTSVTIGGVAVLYTIVDSTTINVVATAGAASGSIVVTTHGGIATSANAFTFIPEITSFTPTAAVVGKLVTITGKHLTGATVVTFNGVTAAFTVVNPTTITATVPVGATSGILEVVAPGGMAISANNFTVIPTLSAITLDTALASPRPWGLPITLIATATGGANVQYKFLDGTTVLRDFATSNTFDWTPTIVKTHTLTVVVRDIDGVNANTTITSAVNNYVITSKLSAVTYTTPSALSVISGANVIFTAAVTGGASVQYMFKDGTTVLRDFAADNTYQWLVPEVTGPHTITVVARDINNTTPNVTVTYSNVFTVSLPLASVVMSTSPANAVLVGNTVTLTATANGGANVQYQFMTGTTLLRSFSSARIYTFATTAVKTYNFTVIAKDLGGADPNATVTSPVVTFYAKPALTAAALTSTPLNAALIGLPVTLTASTTGGANVQYQFMSGTSLIRSFASGNTYTFTPTVAKTYTFSVIARDLSGVDPNATVTSSNLTLVIKPALTAAALTSTPLNATLVGTPVTLTASTTGGANVQYQFMSGTTLIRSFASGNTYSFTPTAIKTYTFTVIARDLTAVDPNATVTSSVLTFTIRPVLTAVSMMTLPSDAVTVGVPVTLTATATGGANVQYKFMNGTTLMRSFNTSNTYTFTPTAVKTYTFTVVASDLGAVDPNVTVTSSVVNLAIKPVLTAVSLAATPTTVIAGTTVTLTATPTGGASLLYKFMNGTTILRDFAASNTMPWTPSVANTYPITVIARDANGVDPNATVTSATNNYVVTAP